jgi:hypothetical protein
VMSNNGNQRLDRPTMRFDEDRKCLKLQDVVSSRQSSSFTLLTTYHSTQDR